jgi:hypothetical protein
MSKRTARLPIVIRQYSQLRCLNEKIASLAAVKPFGDCYDLFALAAHVAGDAIEAASGLQQTAGDVKAFQDALNFWHRVRDYTGTAALNCAGGNRTLSEALITFSLLRSIGG